MNKFHCPNCNYFIGDKKPGDAVKCSSCGDVALVPENPNSNSQRRKNQLSGGGACLPWVIAAFVVAVSCWPSVKYYNWVSNGQGNGDMSAIVFVPLLSILHILSLGVALCCWWVGACINAGKRPGDVVAYLISCLIFLAWAATLVYAIKLEGTMLFR